MKLSIFATALALVSSTAAETLGRRNWKISQSTIRRSVTAADAPDPSDLYKAHNLSVPIDHFHNESMYAPHSDGKFDLRYWFDAQYYKPGGPVIVLMSGETSGEGRLPFLQKGILAQMAQSTNGLGVVLEHRYYGTSFPTKDVTTKSLRFLTTEQALADTTYFAKNVKFPGLEKYELNSPKTAWIAYGGSYAGAFAAFLRKVYPETWWGAISSSGVTVAQWNFWQYFEAARIYGPKECIKTTQQLVDAMDNIMINNKKYTKDLKAVFGLSSFANDDDFGNFLGNTGVGGLQGLNWDPEVSSEDFNWYCGNLSSSAIEFPYTNQHKATVEKLLEVGGYGKDKARLTPRMLNWIGYINQTYISESSAVEIAEENNYHNTSTVQVTNALSDARSWPYQYCSEWGYIQSATGVPKGQLPLISKLVTLDYQTIICREAFNFTKPANTERVNRYGGFNLFYERLAHIGGVRDPWRWVTPLADSQPKRPNTIDQPFFNIANGVHHWDENGVFKNETTATLPPPAVKDAQQQIRDFVKAWVKEWKESYHA